jgi:hypothetical protein
MRAGTALISWAAMTVALKGLAVMNLYLSLLLALVAILVMLPPFWERMAGAVDYSARTRWLRKEQKRLFKEQRKERKRLRRSSATAVSPN